MTQLKLAEILSEKLHRSISQSYISKIEAGSCNISWKQLELICKVFEYKVSQLVQLAESLQETAKNYC